MFFHSSVPQPDMNIIKNQNTTLYPGSILTLTCTVTLDPYVDESITVAIEWSSLRNISGNRYSITPTVNSNSIYTSNFTVGHLETQDSGIYTCTVTVAGGQYVQQTNASDSISITVDLKKIPGVYNPFNTFTSKSLHRVFSFLCSR